MTKYTECAHSVSSLRFQGIDQIKLPRGGNIDIRRPKNESSKVPFGIALYL